MNRTSLAAGAAFVVGAVLISAFHPGRLRVKDRIAGPPDRVSDDPWSALNEVEFSGEFVAPVSADGLLLHPSGCLVEFELSGRRFTFTECPTPYSAPLRLAGLGLRAGERYAYRAALTNSEANGRRPSLEFFEDPGPAAAAGHAAGWLLVLLAPIVLLLSARRISRPEAVVLLTAFAARVAYALKTAPWERTYDPEGHANFVLRVMSGRLLPDAGDCYQCTQPPLAYWLAAVHARLLEAFSGAAPAYLLRSHALFLSGALLLQLALLVRAVVPDARRAAWILLPCAFWPGLISKAGAFSNDPLVYAAWLAFCSASLSRTPRARVAAAGAALAGFAAKASFLAAPLGLALSRWRPLRGWRTAAALLLLLNAAWLLRRASPTARDAAHRIVSRFNPYYGENARVENAYAEVFGFSWRAYWDDPSIDNRDDATGRRHLSNYLLKSAVFGGFGRGGADAGGRAPARVLIGASLALALAFLVCSLFEDRSEARRLLAAMVWSSVGLLSLNRILTGSAIAADARYAMPAVLLAVICVGDRLLSEPRGARAFRVWAAAVGGASVVFFAAL